jgi:AcrR family transcriptional regulator
LIYCHDVSRPRAQPKLGRPRSEESRRAILDAAFRLTRDRGYDNVTAQMIAEEAGAGKQTLYRWWDSKSAVVLDALAEHGRATVDEEQHDAIEKGDLEAFLLSAVAVMTRLGPTYRHLMAQAQSDPALRTALLERLIEPRRGTLRSLLAHRIEDEREREAAVTAVYGAMWYRLLLDEPLDAELVKRLCMVLKLS